MLGIVKRNQDRFAGGLIALLGLFTAATAGTYPIGSLHAMGPGFLPLVLGCILAGLGVLIALNASQTDRDPHDAEGLDHPEIRGWLCIIGGVLAFILLAKSAGLLPATFGCVFISARGDRTATLQSSLLLAACVSAAGVLLFYYGLRIQLPPLNL